MEIGQLLFKMKRLDDIAMMALLEIHENTNYSEVWFERVRRYKLNLINQFKKEVCEKQRKRVVFEQSGLIMSISDENSEEINSTFKLLLMNIWEKLVDIGLNAPEPD